MDPYLLVRDAVIVHEVLKGIDPVLNPFDCVPCNPFCIIHEAFRVEINRLQGVSPYEFPGPPHTCTICHNLSRKIPLPLSRGPDVIEEKTHYLPVSAPLFNYLQWGDDDPFLENGGRKGHGPGTDPSHISVMGPVGHIKGGGLFGSEYWGYNGDVR